MGIKTEPAEAQQQALCPSRCPLGVCIRSAQYRMGLEITLALIPALSESSMQLAQHA